MRGAVARARAVPGASTPPALNMLRDLVRFIFLCRFQLMIGVLLVLLAPLARWSPAQSIIGNMFVLDCPSSVAIVTLLSLAIAATILLTARVTYFNAEARFGVAFPSVGHPAVQRLPHPSVRLLAAPALPMIGLIIAGYEPAPEASLRDLPPVLAALAGAATGGLVFYGIVWASTRLQALFFLEADNPLHVDVASGWRPPSGLQVRARDGVGGLLERIARLLPRFVGDGYVTDKGQFGPGHALSIITFGLFLLIYFALYFLASPERGEFFLPPLAYLLLVLVLAAWALPGLSFFVDYFRVPTLLTLICTALLLAGLEDTDHYFEVTPVDPAEFRPLRPSEVVSSWASSPRGAAGRPMVVLAASGGGIAASAWTARVLTGLQCTFGERFTDALVLISSVSGGTVGSMHFIDRLEAQGRLAEADRRDIVAAADASSLGAVGWGLAYPDLWRATFPLPFFATGLVTLTKDRGWALEQAWRRSLRRPEATLLDWRQAVAEGRIPATVFNATAVESGARVSIATVDTESEFAENYLNWDLGPTDARFNLKISTAARLSATFSYVSPLTRAIHEGRALHYHLADGGYYDNSGMLSAIEWLRAAFRDSTSRPEFADRTVVVIRVRTGDASLPRRDLLEKRRSWLYGIVGPLLTLEHVRTSTQFYRSTFEFELLDRGSPVRLELIDFTLDPPRDEGVPQEQSPLSWHLSAREKATIDARWDASAAPVKEMGRFLLGEDVEIPSLCRFGPK